MASNIKIEYNDKALKKEFCTMLALNVCRKSLEHLGPLLIKT